MSTSLLEQIDGYYTQISEAQEPVELNEIAGRVHNPVRELAVDADLRPRRHRFVAALAGAAVAVLVVGLLPLILSIVSEPPPSDTRVPTTTTTTTIDATTTTTSAPPEPPTTIGPVVTDLGTVSSAGRDWSLVRLSDSGLPAEHGGWIYTIVGGHELYRSRDQLEWELIGPVPGDTGDGVANVFAGEEGLIVARWNPESETTVWYRSVDGSEWRSWSPEMEIDVNVGIVATGLDVATVTGSGATIGDDRVVPVKFAVVLPDELPVQLPDGRSGSKLTTYGVGFQSRDYAWKTMTNRDDWWEVPVFEVEWIAQSLESSVAAFTVNVYRWDDVQCSGSPCDPPFEGLRTLVHTGEVRGPERAVWTEAWNTVAGADGWAEIPAPFYGFAVSHDRGQTFDFMTSEAAFGSARLVPAPWSEMKTSDLPSYSYAPDVVTVAGPDGFYTFARRNDRFAVYRSADGDVWTMTGETSGLPLEANWPTALPLRITHEEEWRATDVGGDGRMWTSSDGLTWSPSDDVRAALEEPPPNTQQFEAAWGYVRVLRSADQETIVEIRVSEDGSTWDVLPVPSTINQVVVNDAGIWLQIAGDVPEWIWAQPLA